MEHYIIYDRRTGERLVGFHDSVRIYEFMLPDRAEPHHFLSGGRAENDIVRIMDRVAGATGRELGVICERA